MTNTADINNPSNNLRTQYDSLADWRQHASTLFGTDQKNWRFICPSCHHIATVQEWQEAGGGDAAGFSCIGRWTNAGSDKAFKKSGGPCNYAGGGLFKLNPVEVKMQEGQTELVFQFAPL